MTNTINGTQLYKLLAGGCENLLNNKQYINALNVFPVPDGDTGENMYSTISGGLKISEVSENVSFMITAFSRNCLLNARGNSGVILSQFIRGIALGLQMIEQMSIIDFVNALSSGVKCAYKAVIKPVEGTILTVMREGIEQVQEKIEIYSTFSELLKDLIFYMKKSLDNTPNLLPVLKQSNVVDSGGAGLVIIFEGIKAVLDGKEVESNPNEYAEPTEIVLLDDSCQKEFGYCTEFILQLTNKTDNFDIQNLIDYLSSIGDSIVAVKDEVLVKVHVHTFTPYKALEYAHQFGEFISCKIENMTLQHHSITPKVEKIKKDIAVVAVASGEGIKNYFSEIGADVIVDGGQSFNPSSQDFINAFDKIEAKYIIVLPNNKNVILSAKQAAELYKKAEIKVIETKTIAEGYSALSMIDTTEEDIDVFIANMSSNLKNVTTGVIALAIKDAKINDLEIKQGKFIGYCKGEEILSCENDKISATINLLKNLKEIDDKETFVIFYGKDVSEEEKDALEESLSEEYPLVDIAFVNGEQQIFSFILCIE